MKRFETEGLAGLADVDRPGRPSKLDQGQTQLIEATLRSHPSQYGLAGNLWDGKLLSHFIDQQFGIQLGVRQCQRLFRRLGFRFRKPRPLIAKADPQMRQDFKKIAEYAAILDVGYWCCLIMPDTTMQNYMPNGGRIVQIHLHNCFFRLTARN